MTIIETSIGAESVSPASSTRVGKGNYIAVGDKRALMAQRNVNGGIRVYIALTVPEGWTSTYGLDWQAPRDTKSKILDRYFGDRSESLKNLVYESGSSELRSWPLYDMPKPTEGGQWKTDLGVRLVGDAAHVMPPWTGRGANMALLGAVELGKKFGQSLLLAGLADEKPAKEEVLKALVQGMRAYERGMWTRMEKEKDENRRSQALLFAEDSPKAFLEMMKQGALPQT